MKVGVIGHVDHGRASLVQALAKIAGAVVMDEATAAELNRDMQQLADVEIAPFGDWYGRPRDLARKAARKARMRELQRRAFLGD